MVRFIPFLNFIFIFIFSSPLEAENYSTLGIEKASQYFQNSGYLNLSIFFEKALQKENEATDYSTFSQDPKVDEDYIIDSTVTYQYNGLKDSIPTYKKVTDDNVRYKFNRESQEWIRYDSTVNYFNDDVNIGSETFMWSLELQKWLGSFKIQLDFDSEGRKVFVATYNWDDKSDNWKGIIKVTNSFYYDGSRKDEISFSWNSAKGDWVKSNKSEYTFDEAINSEFTQIFDYNMSTDEWELRDTSKIEILNEDEMEVRIYYNADENEWISVAKVETVFDDFGNLVLQNSYDFNSITNSWELNGSFEAEAIQQSKYTYRLLSYFNPETKVLVPSSKMIGVYDDQFREVESSVYNWDLNRQQWKGTVRTNHLYNVISDDGKRMNIEESYTWDEVVSAWVLGLKIFHYYQNDIISGLDQKIRKLSLILYPNPVGNEINIKVENEKIKELSLYSSSGCLLEVVSSINKNDFTFPFKYSEGYYFLKVITDNSLETYKIIK